MTGDQYSEKQLIALLGLPARLVTRAIKNTGCPCGGNFCPTAQHCWACRIKRECHWLYRTRTAMKSSQTGTLKKALSHATGLVCRQLSEEKHYTESCLCERCSWLRGIWHHQAGTNHRCSD